MRFDELAHRLRKICDSTKEGEKNTAYFLFACLYEADIRRLKEEKSLKELASAAGLTESFTTEIYKGLRLAPYIELKPEVKAKLLALS